MYESDGWFECCSGAIAVEYEEESQNVSENDERKEFVDASIHSIKTAMEYCRTPVDHSDIYDAFGRAGLLYGPFFRSMHKVRWNENVEATGAVQLQHWKSQGECFTDALLIHPTALDAILQMTLTAYSIYAKNASATTVPTGFRSVWISADLSSAPPDSKALVHAKVAKRGFRNKLFSINAALANSDTPIFLAEIETITTGSNSSSLNTENKPLYRIEYKPDFDLLPNRTLFLEPDPTKDSNLIHDKELLCLTSMRNALHQISGVPNFLPVYLQEYVQWMRIVANKHTAMTSETVEALCQRIEHADVEGRLLVRVAKNLPLILAGEIDPLNLLFTDDILSDFYSNFHSNQQLLSRAAKENRHTCT